MGNIEEVKKILVNMAIEVYQVKAGKFWASHLPITTRYAHQICQLFPEETEAYRGILQGEEGWL